jgi:hypothetical protein
MVVLVTEQMTLEIFCLSPRSINLNTLTLLTVAAVELQSAHLVDTYNSYV